MTRSQSLDDVIASAEKIVRVWEANPTFTLGEVTLAKFKAGLDDLRDSRTQTEEARRRVTELVNATNGKTEDVSGITTRALSGIRAVYGPDSSQYEEAGGTRSSERKKKAASKKKPS
ncbi:MAG: hypothetical protein LC754_15215 [Acidobacteria bacterium]|nr:hypothetical protein [Acidobacteriota bacterium]